MGLIKPAVEIDSPLFLEEAGMIVDDTVGLTSGLGRARFALASAVVLLFFRGTLFVGAVAGLAPGVVVFLP